MNSVLIFQFSFFEVCRNQKQAEKYFCSQITITKHGVYCEVCSVLTAVLYSCVATDFSQEIQRP